MVIRKILTSILASISQNNNPDVERDFGLTNHKNPDKSFSQSHRRMYIFAIAIP